MIENPGTNAREVDRAQLVREASAPARRPSPCPRGMSRRRRRFSNRLPLCRAGEQAIELAEQITGDTSIGHPLAFVMAVEAASGIAVPEPDRLVRARLLELERLYNHVTDLGGLANDAGFGVANNHAQRLRQALMRINHDVSGRRLLRCCLSVGGAQVRSLPRRRRFAASRTRSKNWSRSRSGIQ